jgi:hypothetical protein
MADEAFAPLSSSLEMAALRSIVEGTAQATSSSRRWFNTLRERWEFAIR